MSEVIKLEWENLEKVGFYGPNIQRTRVGDGWLVCTNQGGLTYIPDKHLSDSEWDTA
tara:strand:- start:308 stop:478 length:171 start_codon:yes stop_codon:yes gene_type:complete